MEKLNYIVEDSTIAELLGVQNFTHKESAILELVKNAYDAHAKKVRIIFKDDKLYILDNGIGMDEKAIKTWWMHVGKSDKEYSLINEESNEERILSGSKGVGRFALARLGSSVNVYSSKEKATPIKWSTNWDESILDDWIKNDNQFIGTKIVISKLRDRWTKKGIQNLANYFSITYNDDKMSITVESDETIYTVSRYFNKAVLGENCVSKIKLNYNSDEKQLYCEFESDEFISEAKKYCKDIDLTRQTVKLDIFSEMIHDKDNDSTEELLEDTLKTLGDFNAEFYFSLKSSTEKDVESFLYKYDSLSSRYDKGIVLYRNAFSISSFDGEKDWLEFGKRSRKSPAAATHPSGAWRVRENQISGKVVIDRERNKCLKDLSNRQGIEEDEYYKTFVVILTKGIETFEQYRQSIIRLINKKNVIIEESKVSLIDEIIKNPQKAKNLTKRDLNTIKLELKSIKNESKAYKYETKSTEKRYRYDVRILNVLSTSGLKATSIAHELKNDRNNLSVNYDYIVDALKEYDIWDELISPECTEYSYKNVPELLRESKDISNKILVFMNTMLDEVEKQRFALKELSVLSVLENIKDNWMRDYASLNIILEIDESLCFETSEDIFNVIFDNLILNSLQQNSSKDKINILITISINHNHLEVKYQDDGIGLSKKYIDNPARILVVHETTRKNGHGLGMWIVNNTILMTGGEINKIDGNQGFKMQFEIGDKL